MLVEQLEPKTLCTTNINLKNSTSFNYFFNNLESRIRKKKGGGGENIIQKASLYPWPLVQGSLPKFHTKRIGW